MYEWKKQLAPCDYNYTKKNVFINLVNLNQIWIVSLSIPIDDKSIGKVNYNPNLVRFNKIHEYITLRVRIFVLYFL